MSEKIFRISSDFDNLTLVGTIVEPEVPYKGIVQICHGMSEHRKRYYDFMRFLAKCGYVCVIHDHRGHGESVKSQQDWGYFYDDSGEAIVKDAYQITCYMKDKYPTLPVYLFGHSMGSLVVRRYIQEYDEAIDKLVVCGSASKQGIVNIAIPLVKAIQFFKGSKYRSPLLRFLVLGSNDKKFKEKEYNRWLSANMENVREYNKMPDTGFMFTNNGYLNLFSLMKETYCKDKYQGKHKDLSILFVAGEEDPIIVSKQKWIDSQIFLKEIGYQNIKNILYPNLRHEILQEKNKEAIYEDILSFLNE